MKKAKKKALVFIHEKHEDSALFSNILAERGYAIEEIYVPEHDLAKVDLSADIMLVMGGSMGVYESAKYPFIYKEIEAIRKRLSSGKPLLGICLGSQLMSAAFGAKVFKGEAGQEIGWYEIKLNKAAALTPLKHLEGMMFHWHGDTFDLPAGATLLASSEMYPHQAYSCGPRALALQFHPEVQADKLKAWYPLLNKTEADKVKADTKKYIASLNEKAAKFFNEWLDAMEHK